MRELIKNEQLVTIVPQDFKNLVSQLATLTQNQQNTQNNSINLLILQNLLIDNQKEASQKKLHIT